MSDDTFPYPSQDDTDIVEAPPLVPLDSEVAAEPENDADEAPEDDSQYIDLADLDGQAAKRKSSAARPKLTPALVRRVLIRAAQLEAADQRSRDLLAAALGAKADVDDLTVQSLTASRAQMSAVLELIELAGVSNPFEATVRAMSLEREATRRVWHLLTVLGAVSGSLPAKDVAAGAKLAEAAAGLDDSALESLRALPGMVG